MASTHRGIALLIAISIYDNEENIDSALNDVSEMSRRLRTCDYEVIEATNLEIADIRAKVTLLMDRLDKFQHEEVFVYYAGHGLVHNDEHLIVGRQFNDNAKSQNNEITLRCLSVERDIIDKICSISTLEDEETRSIAVILDTCRSRANVNNRSIALSSLSSEPFILRHETRIGILVGYACALGLKAKENGNGNHGLYTDCVLKSIFEPGASIMDALSNANLLAAKRTNTQQRPFIYVNYPRFFRYSLIQGIPAPYEPPRMHDRNIELLQTEHDKLKLEIEKRDHDIALLQSGHEKLQLEKEKRDRDNELLQTESNKQRLEREKIEKEFQRVQIEFEKFRLENSKMKISDMDIMEKLYKSTQGALWTKNRDRLSWQLNSCTTEFKEADGRITYIDLRRNNLIGTIPQELGRLSYLTRLDLSGNKLKGTIPVELGELKHLTHLSLNRNQLTGAIPKELGELSELTMLSLRDNQLTGKIPKELGELSKLNELWLSGNQLTGAVPKELGQLSELQWLYLHGNQLTGSPPRIPNCNVEFRLQRS